MKIANSKAQKGLFLIGIICMFILFMLAFTTGKARENINTENFTAKANRTLDDVQYLNDNSAKIGNVLPVLLIVAAVATAILIMGGGLLKS